MIIPLAFAIMRIISALSLLVFGTTSLVRGQDSDLGRYIRDQTTSCISRIQDNIGPHGKWARKADPGVVIAAPSGNDPNYFYTWTRDSALVIKALIDRFIAPGGYDANMQTIIQSYIASQAEVQAEESSCGPLFNGDGLGEPRFKVNLVHERDDWSRPQRDGPALRATTIISYGNWLVKNGYVETAKTALWPVIRNDLEYIAHFWNQTGYDVWQETKGSSFFATASQYRALVEGSTFAAAIGEDNSNYTMAAPHVLCFLQNYWNETHNFVTANINPPRQGRSGKDSSTLLGTIQLYDPRLGCDANTFQPCSDKALANHKAVVDQFRRYGINQGVDYGEGIGVGRYATDVYMGGNPWYLCTLAAAEQLYDAIYVWNMTGSIVITQMSLPFWRDVHPNIFNGTFAVGQAPFVDLLIAVKEYADGFMRVVQKYRVGGNRFSEQFVEAEGFGADFGVGARDFSWSYAAFLTAAARRDFVNPPGWAHKNSTTVPDVCSTVSIKGSYPEPPKIKFPPNQRPRTPATTPDTSVLVEQEPWKQKCPEVTSVKVTFNLRAEQYYWKFMIRIVGNLDKLGTWNVDKAPQLDGMPYTSSDPIWVYQMDLKPGTFVEYHYVDGYRRNSNALETWEKGPNRTYTVPDNCEREVVKYDEWGHYPN